MENNAALFADSLLARFGTTMDRLMPAIIDFGRYECRYTVRVCVWLIGVGIIFAIVARFLDKHRARKFNDLRRNSMEEKRDAKETQGEIVASNGVAEISQAEVRR